MQKPFLALGTLFSVAAAAHAQQTNPFRNPYQITPAPSQPGTVFVTPTPVLPPISASKGLVIVAVKADVFSLASGTYDSRELLELLAVKSGGKAIFVDKFQTRPLPLRAPLQGTAAELIEKLRDYGIVAGKLGADWVFLSDDKISVFGAPPLFGFRSDTPQRLFVNPYDKTSRQRYVLPTPKTEGRDFNLKPNPGQVPPNTPSFEFNGGRVYQFPLRPNPK